MTPAQFASRSSAKIFNDLAQLGEFEKFFCEALALGGILKNTVEKSLSMYTARSTKPKTILRLLSARKY
jgi:hypothetical protein